MKKLYIVIIIECEQRISLFCNLPVANFPLHTDASQLFGKDSPDLF